MNFEEASVSRCVVDYLVSAFYLIVTISCATFLDLLQKSVQSCLDRDGQKIGWHSCPKNRLATYPRQLIQNRISPGFLFDAQNALILE